MCDAAVVQVRGLGLALRHSKMSFRRDRVRRRGLVAISGSTDPNQPQNIDCLGTVFVVMPEPEPFSQTLTGLHHTNFCLS